MTSSSAIAFYRVNQERTDLTDNAEFVVLVGEGKVRNAVVHFYCRKYHLGYEQRGKFTQVCYFSVRIRAPQSLPRTWFTEVEHPG